MQNHSYKVFLSKIPISKTLNSYIKLKKLKKIDLISKGDDYQILFTSPKSKRKIINNFSINNKIRITKIGTIVNGKDRSVILADSGLQIFPNNKGYFHNF